MTVPTLSIRNLHKSFADNQVLKGIDLEAYQGDVISIHDKGVRSGNYLQAKARPRLSAVPAFLKVEKEGEKEKTTVVSSPLPEDIPFAFEKRLVIEFYWKIR